ncbi:hypothetical protein PspLS_11580 [Pyricularia sp. CBS 133598]|nr:hypothetical protein PspLS_11580 [Pyricularia sp. CBS 133598]
MKFTALALVASAALCAAAPAESATAAVRPNGLYVTSIDEAGNKKVKFTPEKELFNATTLAALEARSAALEKRREGCGVALSDADSDEANRRLLDTFAGDTIVLNSGSPSYSYNSATSFICVYSSGWKPKSSIAGTWDWVKRVYCGFNRAGYGQVQDGAGDWTAGYTWNGDHYC